MIIRKATECDIPAMMQIIDAAKKFFRENGIDQWQNGNPNADVLLNDIKNGESYIVVNEAGEVCATAMVSLRIEPTYSEIFDGKWLNNGSYGVIHRVAVSPDAKKSGLASMLVSFQASHGSFSVPSLHRQPDCAGCKHHQPQYPTPDEVHYGYYQSC